MYPGVRHLFFILFLLFYNYLSLGKHFDCNAENVAAVFAAVPWHPPMYTSTGGNKRSSTDAACSKTPCTGVHIFFAVQIAAKFYLQNFACIFF